MKKRKAKTENFYCNKKEVDFKDYYEKCKEQCVFCWEYMTKYLKNGTQ